MHKIEYYSAIKKNNVKILQKSRNIDLEYIILSKVTKFKKRTYILSHMQNLASNKCIYVIKCSCGLSIIWKRTRHAKYKICGEMTKDSEYLLL